MKILYSQLKKYLPKLTATPEEIGKTATLIGYMQDGAIQEVKYNGKNDYFIDLEVRQNRADCFSVQGIARELSAYYNIPLEIPESQTEKTVFEKCRESYDLPISIQSASSIKRVMAVKLYVEDIPETPTWLKEYLELYGINSINALVDLTNFVMLETGHPSHAFDATLSTDNLIWKLNDKFKTMTSLDGTNIELSEDALLIANENEPLALAGLVGGKSSAMKKESKEVIIEMAVYNGGLIRRNSRQMRVFTEASSRLEKFMDPDSIDEAFAYLISLVFENCKVSFASKVYDNYLQRESKSVIKVNLDTVKQIAGMDISYEESFEYLYRLGFEFVTLPVNLQDNNHDLSGFSVSDSEALNIIQVRRPVNRLDIEAEEDVWEEIIRLKGYEKIPTDKLVSEYVKDVTPYHITLIDDVRNMLVSQGWDEVLSVALVDTQKNENSAYGELEAITVQNAINEEFPTLRQTIAVSIFEQVATLKKQNVPDVNIFEIGKVFGKNTENNTYPEHYSIGISRGDTNISQLKITLESILRKNGFEHIKYMPKQSAPKSAHPKTIYGINIWVKSKWIEVGVIYVSNKNIVEECSFAEINISEISDLKDSMSLNISTYEFTGKLVALDTNIELSSDKILEEELHNKIYQVGDSLWKWEVADEFVVDSNTKYTVRIFYKGLTDQEAKSLHDEVFGK